MFARTDINVQPVSFHEREAGGLGLRRQCQIHLELISAAKAVRGASTVDKKINFVISKLNVSLKKTRNKIQLTQLSSFQKTDLQTNANSASSVRTESVFYVQDNENQEFQV